MTQVATSNWLGSVLILGIGSTGRAVARYLVQTAHDRVSSITLYGGLSSEKGSAVSELEELGVRVVLGSEEVQGAYDLAIVSPGISEFSDFFASAKCCSKEIIGEPEFAWRESPERWIGITGSNGKTTTTTLATQMLSDAGLSAVAVGNIGNLAISEVPQRRADEWFVAELSSFQLAGSSRLHPRVACLLNITPDHLEWHKTLENYAAAKEKIFQNLVPGDLAIITSHDEWCKAIGKRLVGRGLDVCHLDVNHDAGTPNAAFVRDGRLIVRLNGREHALAQRTDMRLEGDHNMENALAASACALFVGADDACVTRTLETFHPLEHRLEPCGTWHDIRFVNDSKATNTDSVEKALASFEAGSIVVMLGGHDKGTDLSPMALQVAKRCRWAICYGAAGPRIAKAIREASDVLEGGACVDEEPHFREAFEAAIARAEAGDVVLLSPACSSFDEFHGMAERGRLFKSLVVGLSKRGA